VTIDKAIETLARLLFNGPDDYDTDSKIALRLAIEALKRVKEARKKVYFTSRSLLPGETKEG